jgi:sugar phosphate isomerase/epimerase
LEEAADKISQAQFKSIQFNPFCADGKNINPDDLTQKEIKRIRDTFSKNNIEIVSVGSYGRFISPDENEKREIIENTKKWIKIAPKLGSSIVVTEVGSKHPTNNWLDCKENQSKKAWNEVVDVYKELTQYAKKYNVTVAIEPHFGQVLKGAEQLRKLLDDVSANNLKIVYDGANSVTQKNANNQEQIAEEFFELLNDDIVLVHVKDAVIEDGTTQFVPAGKGILPYRKIFNILRKYNYDGHVLLEWVNEDEAISTKEYLEEQNTPPYLIPLLKSDKKLYDNAKAALDIVHANDGALDLKYRLLLSMVADALTRHPAGAVACGKEALEAGATKEEVIEAIRVIYTAGGLPSLIENFDLYREVILK